MWPECKDDACIKRQHERAEKSKVKARLVERLLYRHWDGWRDGKRSHLFRIDAATGEARDSTPGNFDSPPFSLGGGPDYDFSPDGKTLVYASNHDTVEATSTNSDIWELTLGDGKPRCLSCDNKAWDGDARYSPDGKSIAWRAQKKPGFESDKFDLVVYDRATRRARRLTEQWADWVDDYHWAPDSRRLVFTSVVMGRKPIYSIGVDETTPKALALVGGRRRGHAAGRRQRRVRAHRLTRAPELWRLDARGPRALTEINDYSGLAFGQVRERWVALAEPNTRMQAWMVTPPGFDERKNTPRSSGCTADRRARGKTRGAGVGIRRSWRRRATSSTSPIRAARRATDSRSSTASRAIGAARSTTI